MNEAPAFPYRWGLTDTTLIAETLSSRIFKVRLPDGTPAVVKDLKPFDDVEDPTLRNGDIVATESGLMSFRSDGRQAEFVPAASMPGLSAKMKEQLTQTRVAPGPDAAPQPPAPQAAPARPPVNQRAQALR